MSMPCNFQVNQIQIGWLAAIIDINPYTATGDDSS